MVVADEDGREQDVVGFPFWFVNCRRREEELKVRGQSSGSMHAGLSDKRSCARCFAYSRRKDRKSFGAP